MAKILKVVDYLKAPFVWQKTGYKPTVEIEDRIIFFQFPDEQQFRDAVNDFLAGAPSPNIKEYVGMFRVLRGEMMLLKNQTASRKTREARERHE